MKSDVVRGFGGSGCFGANGFQELPVLAGFLLRVPSAGPLGAGFGAGVKAFLVLAHMLDGAEPILLIIDGCEGAGVVECSGLPSSCGMLGPMLALEFGFFAGGGSSFFAAKGFKLLNDHPSAFALPAGNGIKRDASANVAIDFTARLLSS